MMLVDSVGQQYKAHRLSFTLDRFAEIAELDKFVDRCDLTDKLIKDWTLAAAAYQCCS